MKSMKRVVVTGMGAITPIGNSVEEFWNGIKEQKIGFAPITYFDATEYKAHLAAEVKGFNAKDYMSPKAARRMELFSQYAVAATKEAIEDAGLDLEKEDTTRIGVSVGCGVGSLQMIETTTRTLDKKGPNRVKPLAVPMMISNMAAGNVSIAFGLRGKSINVVTACATGTQSIGEVCREGGDIFSKSVERQGGSEQDVRDRRMLPWMATGAVPVRIRTATHFSLENSHRETSHRGRTFRSPWAFVASSLTLKL